MAFKSNKTLEGDLAQTLNNQSILPLNMIKNGGDLSVIRSSLGIGEEEQMREHA